MEITNPELEEQDRIFQAIETLGENSEIGEKELDPIIFADRRKNPRNISNTDTEGNRAYAAFCKNMETYPLLNDDAFRALESDPDRQKKLVLHNLRLVIFIAKKFAFLLSGNSGDMMDLIQEGCIGLAIAAEKFKFTYKGDEVKFSSYATWWIRQRILQYVHNNGRTIRTPVAVSLLMARLVKTEAKLSLEFGREPTDEDLAQAMFLTLKKVKALRSICKVVSLSSPVGEGDDTLENFLPDLSSLTPEEELSSTEERDMPWSLAEKIFARVKGGKRMIYILMQRTEKTLDEIGAELGVSREYIRQIEAKAIGHLQHPKHKKLFRQFI
jgi:RNA polymerase primary sigma factor